MKTALRALLLMSILVVSACVEPPVPKNYGSFRASDPHSVLVVPVVNHTVQVNAPDYFLSTITRPLAERGYYVFPVNLVKRLMEDDGLADADLVHHSDPSRLGQMFGSDSILYVTIERWDAQYIVLATTTTVEIEYRLVDAKTGNRLWREKRTVVYQPSGSGGGGIGGLIAQAIVSAIEKAAPNYMPLARQANGLAIYSPHQGLPAGPHSEKYGKDKDEF